MFPQAQGPLLVEHEFLSLLLPTELAMKSFFLEVPFPPGAADGGGTGTHGRSNRESLTLSAEVFLPLETGSNPLFGHFISLLPPLPLYYQAPIYKMLLLHGAYEGFHLLCPWILPLLRSLMGSFLSDLRPSCAGKRSFCHQPPRSARR